MEPKEENTILLIPKIYKFVDSYFKKKTDNILEIEDIDLKIDYILLDKEEMLIYLRVLAEIHSTIKLEVFSNFKFIIKAFVHYTYKKGNNEKKDITIEDIVVKKLR